MRRALDAPRCIWCHRSAGELRVVRVLEPRLLSEGERELDVSVHSEHAAEARHYYDSVRRFSRTFVYSMLLGCVAPFVFLAFGWVPGSSATLAYLGIIMWLFPFTPATTVDALGIRSSVRLARAFGALFVVGGLLLVLF